MINDDEIPELAKKLHKYQRPKNAYHAETQFTPDEATGLRTMLAIQKWIAGALAVFALAAIGGFVVIVTDHANAAGMSTTLQEIKKDQRENNESIVKKVDNLERRIRYTNSVDHPNVKPGGANTEEQ